MGLSKGQGRTLGGTQELNKEWAGLAPRVWLGLGTAAPTCLGPRLHLLSLSFSSACSFVKTIPCAHLDNPGHAGNSLRGCGSGQVSEWGSKEHTGLSRERLYWQGGREDCHRESCDLRSVVCPGLDTKGLPLIGQTGQGWEEHWCSGVNGWRWRGVSPQHPPVLGEGGVWMAVCGLRLGVSEVQGLEKGETANPSLTGEHFVPIG